MNRLDLNPDGDERGVSEVVGFILSFGIIMASITVLYGFGFPGVLDYQEYEQLHNAERSFDAMAENFDDVARYGGIESRSSEIALRQGTIRTGGPSTTLDITTGGGGGPGSVTLGSFTYESGERTIAYEGGAVFAGEDEGSVVIRQPRVHCDGDKAVITLVEDVSGSDSLLSSDPVMVTMEEQSSRTYHDSSDSVAIEPSGSTLWTDSWSSSLDEAGFSEDPSNTGVWECGPNVAVTIRIVTVEITF